MFLVDQGKQVARCSRTKPCLISFKDLTVSLPAGKCKHNGNLQHPFGSFKMRSLENNVNRRRPQLDDHVFKNLERIYDGAK